MNGKEKTPTEQPIPINLDLGTLHFSMTLGRPSILSDEYRYMLDTFGIYGFMASDKDLQELALHSPEYVEEEFDAIVTSPEQKATYQILGYVLSPEGFIRFKSPFLSLKDETSRNVIRAIADSLLEEDLTFFHPADMARRAMMNPVDYHDGIPRYWDYDEIYAQLLLAFAERGKDFGEIGEHMDKHNPSIYWPGHLGRILNIAHRLTKGDLTDEQRERLKRIIYQDISLIMKFSGLSIEKKLEIINMVELNSGEGF